MAYSNGVLSFHALSLGEPDFPHIRKILCANRGEIAVRVFRAAHELGLRTVAVYASADTMAMHRHRADEAYEIKGEGVSPVKAYLDIERILHIAKQSGCQAIHPGYGFLSENADFARRCAEENIVFIGPSPTVIEAMGDKTQAKKAAIACNVPVVPGTNGPVGSLAAAHAFVKAHGLPIIIKAAFGGGGRGMRVVREEKDLDESFKRCVSEALSAFGNGTVFIERYIESPRHIEVQILGDKTGAVIHLFERDCSVQRRHQKVIEMAPARDLPPHIRDSLCNDAVALGKHLGYENAGTVEFLFSNASGKDEYFFIEVNPRIQVEHTVTEEITGIDIVGSQIRIAAGVSLAEQKLLQEDIVQRGYAIQCRVTAEDPLNGFTPDTGKIEVYNTSSGAGIRLDGAQGYTGSVITPYYDSLLVKVTGHAETFEMCRRRLLRALTEFRIHGVKTNILFLQRMLSHSKFIAGPVDTGFIEQNPELFLGHYERSPAHKVLSYLADILINGPNVAGQHGPPGPKPILPKPLAHVPFPESEKRPHGWRDVLLKEGPKGFCQAVRKHTALLLTDTTWRDAHQSLLMTRIRTYDIAKVAALTSHAMPELFSLEMWGGATFDVALRFLHECPWARLQKLRELVPNVPFQMLLRGANAVGYTSYPDNVVYEFVKKSVECGVDIFRVFDSLNYVPNLQIGVDAVVKAGGVAEACMCYTGDVSSADETKYTLAYYLDLAQQLVNLGTHIIGIKDMAGLLRPRAATMLVGALRERFPDHPIHVHTHDTAGVGVAAMVAAGNAGADIVDGAVDSMSGLTSQPSLGAIAMTMQGSDRDCKLNMENLFSLSSYWQGVRDHYSCFDPGLKSGSSDVIVHQIPGGQYSNLWFQAKSLGLAHQWEDIKRSYAIANRLLGNITKVTPSSKVVGDLAQFMAQNNLTEDDVRKRAKLLSFPSSVVQFFQGYLGIPFGGFPEPLRSDIVRGAALIHDRPGKELPPLDLAELKANLIRDYGEWISDYDVMSSAMYPDVFKEYATHYRTFGDVSCVQTHLLLHPLQIGQEEAIEVENGTKTIYIKLLGLASSSKSDGRRDVFFELNGETVCVSVEDRAAKLEVTPRRRAVPGSATELGAPMSGMVVERRVEVGAAVNAGDPIVVMNAMKMETVVAAHVAGYVQELHVSTGESLSAGDLIAVIGSRKMSVAGQPAPMDADLTKKSKPVSLNY